VQEFADGWRSRGFSESFRCYYDTTEPSRVIAEKMYSINDVVHSMTWPSLAVVVCGLVFLRLQTRRHKLTLCGRRTAASLPAASGDVVKKPLRQQQQQQQQRDQDDGADSDDLNAISTSYSGAKNNRISSRSASAAASDDDDDDDDDDADDDMKGDASVREDTESQRSYPTPQACYMSSSTSSLSSSSSVTWSGRRQRLHLIQSASSPALDDDCQLTDLGCRPLSTSHSAAELATSPYHSRRETQVDVA